MKKKETEEVKIGHDSMLKFEEDVLQEKEVSKYPADAGTEMYSLGSKAIILKDPEVEEVKVTKPTKEFLIGSMESTAQFFKELYGETRNMAYAEIHKALSVVISKIHREYED